MLLRSISFSYEKDAVFQILSAGRKDLRSLTTGKNKNVIHSIAPIKIRMLLSYPSHERHILSFDDVLSLAGDKIIEALHRKGDEVKVCGFGTPGRRTQPEKFGDQHFESPLICVTSGKIAQNVPFV